MKILRTTVGSIFVAAAATVFVPEGRAQEPNSEQIRTSDEPAAAPAQTPDLREEIARLVREDARRIEEAGKKATGQATPKPTDAVQMSPYIVREYHRFYDLESPVENPVLRVIRTGTLLEHVGSTFTTSVHTDGATVPGRMMEDTGVGKVELAVRITW